MDQCNAFMFVLALARSGSLSATAREMNVTPAAISKRLMALEKQLGVSLMHRNTRSAKLSPEGELYCQHAQRILAGIEEMERAVMMAQERPKGLLRINATLGFGRSCVAPVISAFARDFPEMEVLLQLTDRPLEMNNDSCDIGIRFGLPPDARVLARRVALNRRLLCASPAYVNRHGFPTIPSELTKHACIVLRQDEPPYGIWHLANNEKSNSIKVSGSLSTNDGEVALNWALDGHGILMRSEWDLAKYLRSGRLQVVLSDFELPCADIYAIYPEKHKNSTRVKAFIDFLTTQFSRKRGQDPAW
ncbi:MAG: LysR family transcriptional regulator [Sulfuritalea sp.]|nr:LysR family transcriptional regulator [Sulfuritalea sp.]